MKILFVASEVTPFAKIGGIADVVGALPLDLHRLGVDVRVMVPRYERIAEHPQLVPLLDGLRVRAGNQEEIINITQGRLPGSSVPIYFIENGTYLSHGWPIYDQGGEQTDPFSAIRRFLFFSAAATETLRHLGWSPDIVHCHDWMTGIVPALLAHQSARQKTVFTIHNLAYQGSWKAADVLRFLGLDEAAVPALQRRDHHGDFNLVQQGILGATVVNTVSPNYAREVVTPKYGNGLHRELRDRGASFSGILNGLDTQRFNPATDPSLRVRFDATNLNPRIENTLALHEQCGFPPNAKVPTLGFVGRLAEQKGLDLILGAANAIVDAGCRLVILGAGEPSIESTLRALAARFPQQVFVRIGFDATFAQHIYAGSDLFLMPSKFEPCGLGQMLAMRYGAVPVVRATGGLVDTVPDIDERPDSGLGFSFSSPTAAALSQAITRALRHLEDRPAWKVIQRRCMTQDFSWRRSARTYLALYQSMLR